MTKPELSRIAAGALVVLVGMAISFGAVQLWNGAPTSWPDIVASDSSVRTTARVMSGVAALLIITGIATASGVSWGTWAAAIGITLFAVGGFWANMVVFGSLRPMHAVSNVAVAAAILLMLWAGR